MMTILSYIFFGVFCVFALVHVATAMIFLFSSEKIENIKWRAIKSFAFGSFFATLTLYYGINAVGA